MPNSFDVAKENVKKKLLANRTQNVTDIFDCGEDVKFPIKNGTDHWQTFTAYFVGYGVVRADQTLTGHALGERPFFAGVSTSDKRQWAMREPKTTIVVAEEGVEFPPEAATQIININRVLNNGLHEVSGNCTAFDTSSPEWTDFLDALGADAKQYGASLVAPVSGAAKTPAALIKLVQSIVKRVFGDDKVGDSIPIYTSNKVEWKREPSITSWTGLKLALHGESTATGKHSQDAIYMSLWKLELSAFVTDDEIMDPRTSGGGSE